MDSSHLLEAQYLKPVFKRFDINNDNKITKRSLKQCLNRLGRSMTYEEIVEAFKVFDKDGDGLISPEELKNQLLDQGDECTEEDVSSMIEKADLDGDGMINVDEFIKVMTIDDDS